MLKLLQKVDKLIKLKSDYQLVKYLCYFTQTSKHKSYGSYITPAQRLKFNFSSYSSGQSDTGILKPENVDVEVIANGDEELLHKLKVLLLEMEVMRQEGRCVPPSNFLKENHWRELSKLQSISARRKYLEFLFKVSKKKENEQIKKEQSRVQREERLKERPVVESYEEFVKTYDLQHNNIFLRFYDTAINQMYNNRLIQAMQFSQKLVVDCGYDEKMTLRENNNCAKQLMLLFADNRVHEDPYDVHFCNVNPKSSMIHTLHKYIPTMYETWFPMNVHQKSYIHQFPKEQLVYLTPHCREELTEYDHDAVYIIGAIVDKVNNEPLSMAKAKKENIRMAKLPLDRYLQWGGGSGKSLTLNQVISILLDVKRTGDWEYAFRHIPRRKIVDYSIGQTIQKYTDNLRTDRQTRSAWSSNNVRTEKYTKKSTWSPSYNAKLSDLSNNSKSSYNQGSKKADYKTAERKQRLIDARSIMNDE